MDWKNVPVIIKRILGIELFSVGDTEVTTGTVLTILIIIIATFILSRSAQNGLERILSRSALKKEASIPVMRRLVHYAFLLGGIVAALQTVGIDLSTLFAAGAVFAVGLGFAMQNIAQNFVSGIILLVEQSIKPGDVLEVEGEIVKVTRMGIRSTLVRTRNEEELIVPNSTLVQGMVKNFTLSDSLHLLRAEVGVTYDSDMKLVRDILTETAMSMTWRDKKETPRVLMREFGDSSVVFNVFIWISDPWKSRQYLSHFNEQVWWAFKKVGITIAFPQMDVHFDEPVEASLRLIANAAATNK